MSSGLRSRGCGAPVAARLRTPRAFASLEIVKSPHAAADIAAEAYEAPAPQRSPEPTAAAEPEPEALPERLAALVAETQAQPAPTPEQAAAFGALGLGFIVALDYPDVVLSAGGGTLRARAAATLHRAVLETALGRGEPVLIERGPGGIVSVVGALRTQPTPGVDKMEEIKLEADRVEIKGREEVSLSTSGVAQIALRAVGEVETYASRIISRAEEVHKIVGRMLRLN